MPINVESGNISLLLSMLTGACQAEIETMLMNGISPARVAENYGKFDEFNAFFKRNIALKLKALVENNELSADEAVKFFKNAVNE